MLFSFKFSVEVLKANATLKSEDDILYSTDFYNIMKYI